MLQGKPKRGFLPAGAKLPGNVRLQLPKILRGLEAGQLGSLVPSRHVYYRKGRGPGVKLIQAVS